MTDALKHFDLRRHHLFRHAVSGEGQWEYRDPTIRHASYNCQGVLTHLFYRADVEALARQVHVDFDGHMKVRQERRRKLSERKRQKRGMIQHLH